MNIKILKYLFPLFFLSVTSCGDTADPIDAVSQEQSALHAFNSQVFQVKGKVHDELGFALANVDIMDKYSDARSTTDINGEFVLAGIKPKNILLEIKKSDYSTEFIPIYLQLNLQQTAGSDASPISIPTIILNKKSPTHVRMLFGGDVAFGRRYLDVDENTPTNEIPEDDPNALIKVSDPDPGTRHVIKELMPFYQDADWGVFNFETPVLSANRTQALTPHQFKDFVFFTLSESLPAVVDLGIDYVSLGNNHVYDYLEGGLAETISHLDSAGIKHSGAGPNTQKAFNAYQQILSGNSYSFLSMTSIDGRSQHGDENSYVADDRVQKGGAADLRLRDQVRTAIQGELDNNHIPIIQYHTGYEYIYKPTQFMLNSIQLAADENVPLAVLHHPHVAQGVALIDNTYALLGLGNLALDQDRLETMLGVMARVDMNGSTVNNIRMLPVYLEDYVPKTITGTLANNFIRRLGEFSRGNSVHTDGTEHPYDVLLYPYNGQGWVSMTADDADAIPQDRTVTVDVSIPSSGRDIVDLREHLEWGESLLSVSSGSTDISLEIGRDILQFGDFEDWDRDDDLNEAKKWDITDESRYICLSHAHRDAVGLCTTRRYFHDLDTVAALRYRLRVMGDALHEPNKNLSLFGYYKGDNSGPISIVSRYFASEGDLEFGEEVIKHEGGTFDWQSFSRDLSMPIDSSKEGEDKHLYNARALRIYIHQSPPKSDDGLAAFDDLAVISWEGNINLDQTLEVPHARDFLRIEAPSGTYKLTLKIRKHIPAASQ